MKKLTKKEVISLLSDNYILRDYISLLWKPTHETEDYISQKFFLFWECRTTKIEITYFKVSKQVSCSWSCEGYTFQVIADFLTKLCNKLEEKVVEKNEK